VGITISMMFGDAIWGKVASNNWFWQTYYKNVILLIYDQFWLIPKSLGKK
jgi:hypothetical protein